MAKQPFVEKWLLGGSRRLSVFGLVVFVSVGAILVVRHQEQVAIDGELIAWRNKAHAESLEIASTIQYRFVQVYQGLRTVARFPGVRNIDRYATNFSNDARIGVQELYNNLYQNISLSEIYIVPLDFDPDRTDPRTGKLQTPIMTFDEFIVGRNADFKTRSRGQPEDGVPLEEIEIYEYWQMKDQITIFRERYDNDSSIEGLSYPAVSSREVITCDNTYYSRSHPNDGDRAGIVYSVPFYGPDGQMKGIVSAVLLTRVIQEMLPARNFAIHDRLNDYLVSSNQGGVVAGHRAEIVRGVPSDRLLYSEVVKLAIPDLSQSWFLWTGRPDSEFWSHRQVRAIRLGTEIQYAVVVLIAISVSVVYWVVERKNTVVARLNRDLEARVSELTVGYRRARDIAEEAARETAVKNDALMSEISERTSVQSELAVAMDQLERALNVQREFLGFAAHELRTPLATLKARSESLGQTLPSQFSEDIDRMARLVGQLLDFARFEVIPFAGRKAVDVCGVAKSVIHNLSMNAAWQDKTIALRACEPPLVVLGNEDAVFVAIRNLVENALTYAPPSSVVLVRVGADGTVIVADRGPGIQRHEQAAIFQRFRRGQHSANKIGSGLGLALVEKIAHEHGGTVSVRNRVRGGAVFTLSLPVDPDREVE